MSETFSERRIDVDGAQFCCFEYGTGDTLVSLHADAVTGPTALERLLAAKFRVMALEIPALVTDAKTGSQRLAKGLDLLAIRKYALIASGTTAAMALAHAADASPESLVLLSPVGPLGSAEAHLGEIAAPTLILIGTKDNPATAAVGRACERIPDSYPMLVYEADSGMAAERPEALYEAVADFIERHGRFILERQNSVVSR